MWLSVLKFRGSREATFGGQTRFSAFLGFSQSGLPCIPPLQSTGNGHDSLILLPHSALLRKEKVRHWGEARSEQKADELQGREWVNHPDWVCRGTLDIQTCISLHRGPALHIVHWPHTRWSHSVIRTLCSWEHKALQQHLLSWHLQGGACTLCRIIRIRHY